MARALPSDDVATLYVVAEILGSLPGWTWRDDGPIYTEADGTCVWGGAIGTAPDRGVGLRLYPAPRVDLVNTRRLQVRIRGRRGDPFDADRIGSSFVTPVLEAVVRRSGIAGISFAYGAPMGADDTGRSERSDNFLITLDNPEASP